jgi:hypothetical protein
MKENQIARNARIDVARMYWSYYRECKAQMQEAEIQERA